MRRLRPLDWIRRPPQRLGATRGTSSSEAGMMAVSKRGGLIELRECLLYFPKYTAVCVSNTSKPLRR